MKNTLTPSIALCLLLVGTTEASAFYNTSLCISGGPYGGYELVVNEGIHQNRTWHIDECSVGPLSDQDNKAVWAAAGNWRRSNGMHDRIDVVSDAGDCRVEIGDDKWEIHNADQSFSWLDGDLLGVNRSRFWPCWYPYFDGEEYESDIVISNSVTSYRYRPFETGISAAGVLMHEFGHSLGTEHVTKDSVMCSSESCGKWGQHNVDGVKGGVWPESLMPQDVQFGRDWHTNSEPDLQDPAVSPYSWDISPNFAQVSNSQAARWVCPGDYIDVYVTLANLGGAFVRSVGRIVMSPDEIISKWDTHMYSFFYYSWLGSSEARFSVRVPDVPVGVYEVGLVVEGDGTPEVNTFNNATQLGFALVITGGCFLP